MCSVSPPSECFVPYICGNINRVKAEAVLCWTSFIDSLGNSQGCHCKQETLYNVILWVVSVSSVRDAGGGGRSAACSARSPLLLVKSGKNCWCGGTGPGAPDQIIQLYQNYSVNLLCKMCNQVTIKLNSVHILQMVKITRWFLIPNSMNNKSVKIKKGVANQSQIKYQNTNNQLWL